MEETIIIQDCAKVMLLGDLEDTDFFILSVMLEAQRNAK